MVNKSKSHKVTSYRLRNNLYWQDRSQQHSHVGAWNCCTCRGPLFLGREPILLLLLSLSETLSVRKQITRCSGCLGEKSVISVCLGKLAALQLGNLESKGSYTPNPHIPGKWSSRSLPVQTSQKEPQDYFWISLLAISHGIFTTFIPNI